MITLIVACAFFSAEMPGPSEWSIATVHPDAGGYHAREGALCGEVGDETSFYLVHASNITIGPLEVTWVEDLDFDENGIIGFGDWGMAGSDERRDRVRARYRECNDGQQIVECG